MSNYYVKIAETATGKVEKRMGPMSEGKADRVERGASINLDHAEYHIDVEEIEAE